MSIFTILKTLFGAGAVLVTLSVAAPSFAQDLRFGIMFGDERSDFRGNELAICKTPWQIRQAFTQRGYTDIFLNVLQDTNVQVRATQDGVVYLIDYNFCRDAIEGRQPLRAAR